MVATDNTDCSTSCVHGLVKGTTMEFFLEWGGNPVPVRQGKVSNINEQNHKLVLKFASVELICKVHVKASSLFCFIFGELTK